jgi:hypothetical protein
MSLGAAGSRRLLLAGSLLILAGLTARMLIGSYRQIAAAHEAAEEGAVEAQVRHLRRAMSYYVPGNPWVRQGRDELLTLARQAERQDNDELALHAYRELRSAVLALRGLTTPHGEVLGEVNRAIARLSGAVKGGAPALATPEGQQALERKLADPPAPRFWWAALGIAGLVLWIAAGFTLLLGALRPDATIISCRFWPLAGLVALGLVTFYAGMALA